MAEWVTADEILVDTGAAADPTAASDVDREWATVCAAAVSAGFDTRLEGATFLNPLVEPPVVVLPPELIAAARFAGIETYKRREAAFGVTGYVDLQGAAIRVARDYLEAVAPIIARYATVGIA